LDDCPICQKPANNTVLADNEHWWCPQCGKFIISGSAVQRLENQRARLDFGTLSEVVRRHPRDAEGWMCITSYNLDELIAAAA
jgi:hypothetical protein